MIIPLKQVGEATNYRKEVTWMWIIFLFLWKPDCSFKAQNFGSLCVRVQFFCWRFSPLREQRGRQNWKSKRRNTQRLSKSQVTELEACKIHLVNQLTQLRKLKSYPGWLKTAQTVNLFEQWLSSLLIFVYWNSRGVFDVGFYFEIALCNTRKKAFSFKSNN